MSRSITVFCGSSSNCDEYFLESAKIIGTELSKRNFRIYYGAGKSGLMGYLADSALKNNAFICGIIPEDMYQKGLAHENLAELIVTENIDKRKKLLIESGDIILVLPGGVGTLEELFQVLSWKYLGLTDKPIIIYNLNDYFAALSDLLKNFVVERFMNSEFPGLYKIVNSHNELLSYLDNYYNPGYSDNLSFENLV